jgi:hypothetical protein
LFSDVSGWRGEQGKREPEGGSAPWRALNAHLPLLTAHQLLANMEAQAEPTAYFTSVGESPVYIIANIRQATIGGVGLIFSLLLHQSFHADVLLHLQCRHICIVQPGFLQQALHSGEPFQNRRRGIYISFCYLHPLRYRFLKTISHIHQSHAL